MALMVHPIDALSLAGLATSQRPRRNLRGTHIPPESAPNTCLYRFNNNTSKTYVLRVIYAFKRLLAPCIMGLTNILPLFARYFRLTSRGCISASSVLCDWVLTSMLPGPPGACKSGIGPVLRRWHRPTQQLWVAELVLAQGVAT